ncbi:MAG: ATP-binding protein [Thermodesulfobacteriota bacterium]
MARSSFEDIKSRISLVEEVIENLPIGVIVIDAGGKILMMNRWQEKISRVRREQVLGSYFHEKWERLFQQGIMSDYWKLLKDGTPFQTILHDVYPQFYDQKISAISRGAPLLNHQAFILLHDVSSEIQRDKRGLERLTRELENQTSFLTNLIDSSPNVVISTDRTGRIQLVNRTGEVILGYAKEELAGRDIAAVLDEQKASNRIVSAAQTGRPIEVWGRRKSGETFPARMQVRDIQEKDGPVQAKLFLINDITWEKTMEKKLAISERLAIYAELMAGIAHQLNNPLVGVASFSSLLIEKLPADDPNRALAETIHEAAQRCQTLLSSMIKGLSDPGSTFHSVNLGEVLDQAWKDVIERQPAPNIIVARDLPDDLPTVRGDSIQLLEVFRNILTNALQAMPEGGRLGFRAGKARKEKGVWVEISDTGPGIPPNLRTKIFEPFFTTKKGTGRGLGLSFAFRVIENHGGRIEVREARPRGSVFKVVLPGALTGFGYDSPPGTVERGPSVAG